MFHLIPNPLTSAYISLQKRCAHCGKALLQSQPVGVNPERAAVSFHHIINSRPVLHETMSKKNNKQINKWEIKGQRYNSVVTCLPHDTDGRREKTEKEGGRRRKGRKVVSFQSWRHEKARCSELETPCLINTRSARQRPAPGNAIWHLQRRLAMCRKNCHNFPSAAENIITLLCHLFTS